MLSGQYVPRSRPTLEIKERAGVCGFLRGGLGDGEQVGAVAPQDGRHEAQEGLLDLQLQSVQALPVAELPVSHSLVLRVAILTVQLANYTHTHTHARSHVSDSKSGIQAHLTHKSHILINLLTSFS